MKRSLLKALAWCFLAQPLFADLAIDSVLLTPQEAAPECEILSGSRPARREAEVFYEHGAHSERLPLVLNKRAQSFRCGRDKGSLYYFEYADTAQREKAEVAARTTLWGADIEPTPRHPENIFHQGRFLMVSSFKTMQRSLLTALLKKFKLQESASTPSVPAEDLLKQEVNKALSASSGPVKNP